MPNANALPRPKRSSLHTARQRRAALCEPLEARRLLTAAAISVYVDLNATTGLNNGSSWANAFTDLQPALTTAISGETIDVAQGTYYPTSGADRSVSFQLKSGVALYGGFEGAANPTAARNVTAYPTILSGDIGVAGNTSDDSNQVVQASGVDVTAILDGFTITAGNAGMFNMNASPTLANCTFTINAAGGGMTNDDSSPMLTDCTFTENTGGGMRNTSNSSPILTDCTFSGNTTYSGAGMYNGDSSPTLTNCTFSDNTASGGGGGMANENSSSPTLTACTFNLNTAARGGGIDDENTSSPTLVDCIFSEDSATNNSGGGMDNENTCSPTLTGCVFSANTANAGGGGMENDYSSSPTLTNCTFSGNSAIVSGGGLENLNGSSPTLANCILWGDSIRTGNNEVQDGIPGNSGLAYVTFSDVQDGFNGTGNINADPLFVNAGSGNLELQAGSPCVAAGNVAAVPMGVTTDPAGNPRIFNGKVDMGAYEFVVGTAPTFTNANSTTFTVGAAGSFSFTANGYPTKPALGETGSLPMGVTFHDNGDGTATLSGTPGANTGGVYVLMLSANNGVSPNGAQSFTLTVDQAPAITSANAESFQAGSANTFVIHATGFPTPALSKSGTLPNGVMFHDNGNGTATISGTPAVGVGGDYNLALTASNGVAPDAMQSFDFTVNAAPSFTSASSTAFAIGSASTFTVMASGFPAVSYNESGTLPSGVTFTDNGNGTATFAGTPAKGTKGTYTLTIKAKNGVKPNAKQVFTLSVGKTPAFTSVSAVTFKVGTASSFTISTNGFPLAALSESGILPVGITLQDNGNGTATLTGTPAKGSRGVYFLTLKAKNGIKPNATQTFTLTVVHG